MHGGAKPENLVAVAELIREGLSARLVGGGYNVVDAPGPNIVYLRIALTDLYLKKKKRKLLAYTPIGAVAKAGADIVREMMDKVDIIEMALTLTCPRVSGSIARILRPALSVKRPDPAALLRAIADQPEWLMSLVSDSEFR
jgi:hypothetical protein